jgi:ribonuclease R
MNKPPSKRGSGRGGKPRKPSADHDKPGKKLPSWMPDPGLARAMGKGGGAAKGGGTPKPGAAGGGRRRGPAAQVQAPTTDPNAEREAERYEKPIASREMILQVLAAHDGPMDAEALATALDIDDEQRADALQKRLRAMLRDAQLLQNRRGGFVPAERADLIAGTVIANPDGFGFLRPEKGEGDDLFLPPFEMRKVLHGDRVLASVTGVDRRGRREGVIVEVLEHRLNRLIGRFIVEAGISYVQPDDARIQRNVLIPPGAGMDAKPGQLVVAEITQPPDARKPPIGKLVAVLGDKLTASLAVEAAIYGHEIPHEFPEEVIAQATAVPLEVTDAEIAERVDLRQLPLLTIDGEDAKDFDDAVWCEPNREGFRLIVAIADVSHYVRPGTPLDEEASRRATSVYFPGYVVPMLPETLSNGICSLKPEVERLCFVCDMQIGRDGIPTRSKFYEAVMRSHVRLTYTQVWNAVGEGIPEEDRDAALAKIGKQLPQVERLHQLYRILDKARARRGAIEFETSEVRFVLGPQGEVTQAGMIQRNDAHKLIE